MGAAAVEPDDWAIDQAIAEYASYSASGRLSVLGETKAAVSDEQVQRFPFPWEGGEVQLCGAPADETHWTVAYVPDGGEVITPLAVGTREVVTAAWTRIRDAIDPREVPPPQVRFGDVRRPFRPAHGRFLLGVAQEGASTILLAALGEQIAVVLLEGRRRVVLDVKAPLDLREVDVDRMRRFVGFGAARAAEARVAEEARVSATTQAHHIRITHGLPTEVAGGPSIPEVVWRCFKGLMFRALALRCEPRDCPPEQVEPVAEKPAEQVGPTAQEPAERPGRRKGKRQAPAQKPAKRPARLKGKKYVRPLLRALFLCSFKGSLDLVGGAGVLLRAIQKHDPSFKITLEALADVLNLLRATGTCLVTRPDDERIWHVRLVGLNDPNSVLHRRLLEETPIPFRFPAAATNEVLAEDDEAMPTVTPPPSSSGAGADRGGQRGGKAGEPTAEAAENADAAAAKGRSMSAEHAADAGEPTASDAAATSSAGARSARPASPSLDRVLLLAAILASWEAAVAQVATVARELDELRAQVASLRQASVQPPGGHEQTTVVAEVATPYSSAPNIELVQPQQRQAEGQQLDPQTADPTIGLTEAFDLPRVELSSLIGASQTEADLRGPEPPPRAYFEVAGFLAWPRWIGATRRSLGGLVPRESADDERRNWFGNDYGACATASMPGGPLALGSLGARGPPHLLRRASSSPTTTS